MTVVHDISLWNGFMQTSVYVCDGLILQAFHNFIFVSLYIKMLSKLISHFSITT